MKPTIHLEDVSNNMAVVRTTFETMEVFSTGDPIRLEFQTMLISAKKALTESFETAMETLRVTILDSNPDLEAFRSCALEMMERGTPTRILNRMMRVTLFDEGEDTLYYLKIAGMMDIEEAKRMNASQLMFLLFNEVAHSAREETNYRDGLTFDGNVFQQYIAFMFLWYVSITPIFYGQNPR